MSGEQLLAAAVVARRRLVSDRARYTEALEEALEGGETYESLGKALGISRQSVWQHVTKERAAR